MSSVFPAGTIMLLRTIVEQDPFDAVAASASVKVQPEDAVMDPGVAGSFVALSTGPELISLFELGDAGGELADALETLAEAAREDRALLCGTRADSTLDRRG